MMTLDLFVNPEKVNKTILDFEKRKNELDHIIGLEISKAIQKRYPDLSEQTLRREFPDYFQKIQNELYEKYSASHTRSSP